MTSPATESDVLVEVGDDAVALVTLNRPERLNAMTHSMHLRYVKALHDLDADPGVRAIVVTGAGRGWCAGADLGSLGGLSAGERPPPDDPALTSVDPGWPLALGTPLIAAVNGPVAGMGFSYLLMADVRYAARGATLSSTFARLGLVAEWGSGWLLPRIVGAANAADILLTGDTYDADELLARGLFQKVLEPTELLPAAMAWARGVAAHCSPRSTALIKAALRDVWAQTPQEAFTESVSTMMESFGWPDLAEAVTARAEQRAPAFPPYSPTHQHSHQEGSTP